MCRLRLQIDDNRLKKSRQMLRTTSTLNGLMRRVGVISLMTLAGTSLVARQSTPPPAASGTSAIRGRVLDSLTKAPVAGCTLRASAAGGLVSALTDQGGAYEIKDVAGGQYFFVVQCPAQLSTCLGRDLRSCQVDVARDQERDVDFLVAPGAMARGQVMTFDGRPVTRATVRLGRGMRAEPTPPITPTTTDTEGRFKLVNLPAGEWRLEVEIPPVPGGLRPPIVYYPGGLSWEEAVGVTLEAGKVIDRLTIVVPRINENVLTIVMPPADATISNLAVSVLRQSPLAVRQIHLNAEGVGTIKGVLPGRYFVAARAASSDRQWAAFEVVDFIEDSYESRLQLVPTGSISGSIVAESGPLPSLEGAMVAASWIYDGEEVNPLALDEVKAAVDGSFRVDNLFGTRKLQLRGLGVGWDVAAVRQGRADVTTDGIVVVPDTTIEATIVVRRR
jgi:hypothetical protein